MKSKRAIFALVAATALTACGSDGGKSKKLADLTAKITKIHYDYSIGVDPPHIMVDYKIDNAGDTFPADYDVDIFLTKDAKVDGPGHDKLTLQLPAEGEQIAYSDAYGDFPLDQFDTAPMGKQTARIEVDNANVIPETNDDNNVSEGFDWTPVYPDLTVKIDNVAYASGMIAIDYTISNEGKGDAPAFRVDIWDDLSNGPAPSAGSSHGDRYPSYNDGLAAGDSISDSITFGVNCNCETGTAWVTVDQADANPNYLGQSKGEVFESDETNNFDSMSW